MSAMHCYLLVPELELLLSLYSTDVSVCCQSVSVSVIIVLNFIVLIILLIMGALISK